MAELGRVLAVDVFVDPVDEGINTPDAGESTPVEDDLDCTLDGGGGAAACKMV